MYHYKYKQSKLLELILDLIKAFIQLRGFDPINKFNYLLIAKQLKKEADNFFKDFI